MTARNSFNIVALQKKPELLELYFNQHKESHFKSLKATLEFRSKPLKEAVKNTSLKSYMLRRKRTEKAKTSGHFHPKTGQKKAELTDLYNCFYTDYSNSIHSNPSALDDHVDSKPEEINLAFGPSDKDLYDILRCG